MKTKSPNLRAGERGSLLVLVMVSLLALTGLVLFVLDFAFQGARDTGLLTQEYAAEFSAEAGLDIALTLLSQDAVDGADTMHEPWAIPFKTGSLSVYISPCNGRLNPNGLAPNYPAESTDRMRQALRQILIKNGQTADKADFLREWLEPSTSNAPGSTADLHYSRSMPRYSPRRGNLQRPEELLLVRGWDHLDPTWVRENFATWGEPHRLNLNFVSEETLKAYLPELGGYYQAIDAWRRNKGFQDVSQLLSATGLAQDSAAYTSALPHLTVTSDFFQIIIEVNDPGMTVWTRYIVRRGTMDQRQKAKVVCRDVLLARPLNI